MTLTEIRIYPIDEDRLKAYVTVVLDDVFVVRDIKIIRGNNGLFVAMPSKKLKDGKYQDIAHPVTKDTRIYFEKEILAKYSSEISDRQDGAPKNQSDEEELSKAGK